MSNDQIFLSQEGYEQYCDEIKKLEKKRLDFNCSAGESIKDAIGDGWHDNFAFEEAMRESRLIDSSLVKLLKEKNNIKIINNDNIANNCIKIGDTVKIAFICLNGEKEIEEFVLTGKYTPNEKDNIQEITLNSPLGRAIFKAKIGSIISYEVNKIVYKVEILEKNK